MRASWSLTRFSLSLSLVYSTGLYEPTDTCANLSLANEIFRGIYLSPLCICICASAADLLILRDCSGRMWPTWRYRGAVSLDNESTIVYRRKCHFLIVKNSNQRKYEAAHACTGGEWQKNKTNSADAFVCWTRWRRDCVERIISRSL